MPVYKRSYRTYQGKTTRLGSRFLVLTRFSSQQLWRSRFLYAFFLVCFIYPAICLGNIYLQHNLELVKSLQFSLNKLFPVDASFFFRFMQVQGGWGYLLTVVLGAGLISPDLANNALPLYLCRPVSRFNYVLGKMMVLALPLAFITLLPGIFLYLAQGYFEGIQWLAANWQVGITLLLGFSALILVYCLLCLVISAWVKWRMVAGGILVGGLLIFRGIGLAINQLFGVTWGNCLNLREVLNSLWVNLLGVPGKSEISLQDACGTLLLIIALAIYLLSRKIKACEVVA
jgi:ABC-2 type transport system permease protein